MPISKIADLKTKNRQCKIRYYFDEMLAILVTEMNVGCKRNNSYSIIEASFTNYES